jgi:Fe-S-cluster-containing dehydrogenase component
MDQKRRSFLKNAGCAALGLGCGFPLLGLGCSASKEGSDSDGSSTSQLAMIVDVKKCLKEEVRKACIDACHQAHNVPKIVNPHHQVDWIKAEQRGHVFPDQTHEHTAEAVKESPVLVLCNHCEKPPCVKVCPTAATWKREGDGVVMMDMHRCIGCRYCMAACPYGARSFNWSDPRDHFEADRTLTNYPPREKGVVEKCTFCAELIREGRLPACVEAAAKVPGGEGALTFGDLGDKDSDVSKILADGEKNTICRRVSLGTGPNVYYIV